MTAGNDAALAAAKQTAKGTPAAAAVAHIYLADGFVLPVPATALLEQTSAGRFRNRSYKQSERIQGSPAFWAVPDALGLFFYLAFGAQAIAGAADPWTHTFTMATAQPYATFWSRLVTLVFGEYRDCKVGRLRLESSSGNPIRVIIDVEGLDPRFADSADHAGKVVIAVEDVDPFYHYDGAGALLVEGVAATEINVLNLELQNNLSWQQGDAITGFSVEEGMRAATLEVAHVVVNAALYNRFHYGSATPSVGAEATKNVIELAGSGIDFLWTRQPTPERSLRITATRLQIGDVAGFMPNVSGEPLRQTVPYNILQPAGAVSPITAILKNGRSTIY